MTGLVLCNHLRFFMSWVLLLGFGKLLSIKKKCHCRFVVMCVGFTMNCKISHDQSRFRQTFTRCFFTRHDPHSCTSRYVYITEFFTMKLTSRHARRYGHTQSGVIQHLAQTQASKMTSKFPLSSNLHGLLSPDLNVKFNVLSLFFRRMKRW